MVFLWPKLLWAIYRHYVSTRSLRADNMFVSKYVFPLTTLIFVCDPLINHSLGIGAQVMTKQDAELGTTAYTRHNTKQSKPFTQPLADRQNDRCPGFRASGAGQSPSK